jgi:Ser/Thr protein kinase RdoA (MazF antagonist)
MIHFDFNDGNYSIDFDTGQITVYDFNNSCYCWYMFDLATLWSQGVGWFYNEPSTEKRKTGMDDYFATVPAGYKSETLVDESMLDRIGFRYIRGSP